MDAIGLFEGRQHVTRWASPGLVELVGFDPTGMPAREAFPGYTAAQALMDRCLATGLPQERVEAGMDGSTGVLVILPLIVRGRVAGVTTGYRAVPQRHPAPAAPAVPRRRVPVATR